MSRTRISFVVLWMVAVLAQSVPDASAQIYHVKEMNTEQIRALNREKTVVLLPGGILEQHGPYLPSFTDGYMNERLTQELADAIVARPGWKVLIFPLIPLGAGGANVIGRKYVFDGTYHVHSQTLRRVFMDLASELGEAGFRWIFVVHLHGAPYHHRALNQAGDYFHDTYGGHMVHLNGFMYVREAWREAQELLSEEERKEEGFSVHAGMAETSVTLFLRPDLVSPAYKEAPPYTGQNREDLSRIAEAEGWPGYFGSPRLASAAAGARIMKALSTRWIELALKVLDGFDYRQMQRWGDVAETLPANAATVRAALEHEQQIERKQLEWLKRKGLK